MDSVLDRALVLNFLDVITQYDHIKDFIFKRYTLKYSEMKCHICHFQMAQEKVYIIYKQCRCHMILSSSKS